MRWIDWETLMQYWIIIVWLSFIAFSCILLKIKCPSIRVIIGKYMLRASVTNSFPLAQNGRHFRHFEMHFHEWKFCILTRLSLQFVPKGLFNNILALDRRKAMIWSNADQVHWHIYVAVGGRWVKVDLNMKKIITSIISCETPLCHNFNGGLKARLKLGNGWVIESHCFTWV